MTQQFNQNLFISIGNKGSNSPASVGHCAVGEEGEKRGIREGAQQNRGARGRPASRAQVEGTWWGEGQEELGRQSTRQVRRSAEGGGPLLIPGLVVLPSPHHPISHPCPQAAGRKRGQGGGLLTPASGPQGLSGCQDVVRGWAILWGAHQPQLSPHETQFKEKRCDHRANGASRPAPPPPR